MTVDILILGAGWLSTFLIPLCNERGLTYAATTRDGRDGTLTFVFDPSSDEIETYRNLPDASTVLITFPITESGGPTKLVNLYTASRQSAVQPRFLLLGATNIWEVCLSFNLSFIDTDLVDRRSVGFRSQKVLFSGMTDTARTIQDLGQSRSRNC